MRFYYVEGIFAEISSDGFAVEASNGEHIFPWKVDNVPLRSGTERKEMQNAEIRTVRSSADSFVLWPFPEWSV
jgi:hypothetical protein